MNDSLGIAGTTWLVYLQKTLTDCYNTHSACIKSWFKELQKL